MGAWAGPAPNVAPGGGIPMTSRSRALALALALALPAAATAAPKHRVHPEFDARMAAVRTVGLVAPEVSSYELTANGTLVPRPDWTDGVRANVAAALEGALRARKLAVKRVDPAAPAAKEELREVQRLYEAVGGAILQATYANSFPWKLSRFEYTLGDLGALAAAEGVDALVFTYGVGTNSSGGRIAAELLLGVTARAVDQLFIAVVDRSGAVLWFAQDFSASSDLRDPAGARYVVDLVTNLLPAVPR